MLKILLLVGLLPLLGLQRRLLLPTDCSEEGRVWCDARTEFYCWTDNRCISNKKVCNFLDDCSDGEDELACGSCDFGHSIGSCGLRLIDDKILGWNLRPDSNVEFGHINLDFRIEERQYADSHRNPAIVYRPKILFPDLRPTDNEKCTFLFKLRTEVWSSDLRFEQPPKPVVKMLLVEPSARSGDNPSRAFHELVSLDLKSDTNNRWLQKEIGIHSRPNVWSMILLVETSFHSSPVEFADFKFVDCKPIELSLTEAEQVVEFHEPICGPSEFKCSLSKNCIDESLVCDFGHDCGHLLDDSDEQDCGRYPGRCDFEQPDACQWLPSPTSSSWLWMGSSLSNESASVTKSFPKPKWDHTFESSSVHGHFMLFNTRHASTFGVQQLIGPRVALKPGARQCNFRFWLQASANLRTLESPYLTVGYEHFYARDIFKSSSSDRDTAEGQWRRFQVPLLSAKVRDEVPIYALHLAFGNLSNDFEAFIASNSGYLALDDFSFSPGCLLVYHTKPPEAFCQSYQYQCHLPTPITKAICIPLELYCDFKDDCGRDPLQVAGSDELDCASECEFNGNCGFAVLAGEEYTKVAFKWWLSVDANRKRFLEIQATSNEVGEDLRIDLPKFSSSHGNCSFELNYEWSKGARGFEAALELESDLWPHDILFGRIEAGSGPDSGGQLTVGLGERLFPFRMRLRVSRKTEASGSLVIHSYKFLDCSFPSGLIDASNQTQVQLPEDEDEDEDEEDDLEEDFVISRERIRRRTELLNITCPVGHFQCHGPVLCLPERFRCDLQRDCQLSGIDEANCTETLQSHFYMPRRVGSGGRDLNGWRGDERTSNKWAHSNVSVARVLGGPPVDHTTHVDEGTFLAVSGAGRALIYSPRLRRLDSCRRVVLYVWSSSSGSKLAIRTSDNKLLLALSFGDALEGQLRRWQRVEVSLEANGTDDFFLALEGSARDSAALLAIDDVVFGPSCKLSSNQMGRELDLWAGKSEGGTTTTTTWGWLPPLAIGLALLASSFAFVSLVVERYRIWWASGRQVSAEAGDGLLLNRIDSGGPVGADQLAHLERAL